MKRLIAIAGAGAMLLSAVTPAFAHVRFQMPSYDYDFTNKAYIDTEVTAIADTGDNTQKLYTTGSNLMGTGDAVADASAVTFANLYDVCGGCLPKGDVDLYNKAHIDTDVFAKADTGDNYQKISGGLSVQSLDLRHHHQQQPTASNVLWTGNASSWGSAFTVVNASWMPSVAE